MLASSRTGSASRSNRTSFNSGHSRSTCLMARHRWSSVQRLDATNASSVRGRRDVRSGRNQTSKTPTTTTAAGRTAAGMLSDAPQRALTVPHWAGPFFFRALRVSSLRRRRREGLAFAISRTVAQEATICRRLETTERLSRQFRRCAAGTDPLVARQRSLSSALASPSVDQS